MRVEYVTETTPRVLDLSEEDADALAAAGKRLAGAGAYWGHVVADADNPAETTVIRCDRLTHGRYRVTVAEAVGIVALSSLQLVVEPKIPPAHFRYLLERSPAFPRLDDQQATAAESSELWDLVAAWFVAALERLLRRGLVADYEEQHEDLPYMRGTVHAVETASAYYRGRVSFSCLFDEFGLDSPMNRVLRAATATIAAAPVLKLELRKRARHALSRFIGVGELRPGDARHAPERRSAHYAMGLQLARHVLAATGRTIAPGSTPAWTFLIRTPELIEDAVRSILRRGLHDVIDVKKSGRQLKPSKLTINPDLVFGSTAVGDVKYSLLSSDWKRSHLYQAVAFATGYRVSRAGVFGFTSTGTRPPELQVGPVHLRAFTWLANDAVAPQAAEAKFVNEARTWIGADA
jgi:5-methylcytosine-specific restriction enzyme subunit McrC